MKKLILNFLVFSVYSYASLVGSNFSQRDILILEDLNIKSSFITDTKLQQVYEQLQNQGNSQRYVFKLNEASLFVPRIKDVLKQKGIPDVFIYMAMAESNFTIDARSNAKAMGLWQFMHRTAERYGLKIDSYVDERMDLVKSTVAAADYLNSLYNRFGKWYLATLAYNCGEGRVIEAITRATLDIFVEKNPKMKNNEKIQEYRQTIKDYQEKKRPFIELQKIYSTVSKWGIELDLEYLLKEQEKVDRQYLPKESRRYIRKIISLAMLNSKSLITKKENSHLLNMGISTTVATVPVKGGLHLKNISEVIDMDYEELHKLNKHLKQGIIPPYEKFYTINIPYDRLAEYNQNKDNIQGTKFVMHSVEKGDTLIGISKKYQVPTELIRKYNNLKTDRLSLNQQILLPVFNDLVSLKENNKQYLIKNGEKIVVR